MTHIQSQRNQKVNQINDNKKKNKRKGHGQVIAIKSEFKVSAGPSKSSESNEPKKKMCFMFWH